MAWLGLWFKVWVGTDKGMYKILSMDPLLSSIFGPLSLQIPVIYPYTMGCFRMNARVDLRELVMLHPVASIAETSVRSSTSRAWIAVMSRFFPIYVAWDQCGGPPTGPCVNLRQIHRVELFYAMQSVR